MTRQPDEKRRARGSVRAKASTARRSQTPGRRARDTPSQATTSDGAPRLAGQKLELVSLRFVRIHAETTTTALDDLPGEVEVQGGFTQPEIGRRDDQIAISSTFKLEIAPRSGEASTQERPRPVVSMSATAEVLYRLRPGSGEIDGSELRQFADLNAPYTAWPYWREVIQSTFVRLGLPVIRLPLVYSEQIAMYMLPER